MTKNNHITRQPLTALLAFLAVTNIVESQAVPKTPTIDENSYYQLYNLGNALGCSECKEGTTPQANTGNLNWALIRDDKAINVVESTTNSYRRAFQIRHEPVLNEPGCGTALCLGLTDDLTTPVLQPCDGRDSQYWIVYGQFTYYGKHGLPPEDPFDMRIVPTDSPLFTTEEYTSYDPHYLINYAIHPSYALEMGNSTLVLTRRSAASSSAPDWNQSWMMKPMTERISDPNLRCTEPMADTTPECAGIELDINAITDPTFCATVASTCPEQCPQCQGELLCSSDDLFCTNILVRECTDHQDFCSTLMNNVEATCNKTCIACQGGTAICSNDPDLCTTTLANCASNPKLCELATTSCPDQCITCPAGSSVMCDTEQLDENNCKKVLCPTGTVFCPNDPNLCPTVLQDCDICPTAIAQCPEQCRSCPAGSEVVCSDDPSRCKQLCPDGDLLCTADQNFCANNLDNCASNPLFCQTAGQTCPQQENFCTTACPCNGKQCQGVTGPGTFVCSTDVECPPCTCPDGSPKICITECPNKPTGMPVERNNSEPGTLLINPNMLENGLCLNITQASTEAVSLYDATLTMDNTTGQEREDGTWFSPPQVTFSAPIPEGPHTKYSITAQNNTISHVCQGGNCTSRKFRCAKADGTIVPCASAVRTTVSRCKVDCQQCIADCTQCVDCPTGQLMCDANECTGGTNLCSQDDNFCTTALQTLKTTCSGFCGDALNACKTDPTFCTTANTACPQSCRACNGTLLCDADANFCTTMKTTCAQECGAGGTLVCDNIPTDPNKCKQAMCPTGNLLCDTDTNFCTTILNNNTCPQNCKLCTGNLLCTSDSNFCTTGKALFESTCNIGCKNCTGKGGTVCESACPCDCSKCQ